MGENCIGEDESFRASSLSNVWAGMMVTIEGPTEGTVNLRSFKSILTPLPASTGETYPHCLTSI